MVGKSAEGDGASRKKRVESEIDEDDSDESSGDSEDDELDLDDADAEDTAAYYLAKLRKRIEDLEEIRRLAKRVGEQHPFFVTQKDRVDEIRGALLLDLGNALKRNRKEGFYDTARTVEIMALYRRLDAGKDAVVALKSAAS